MTKDLNDSVTLVGVHKSLGGREVLSDVSLDLGGGEIHVLLGPNGSGKTTLTKIVSGLAAPDKGGVSFFGETVKKGDESFRRRIGHLFDHSSHWDALTGYENAFLFARSFGLSARNAERRLQSLFRDMRLDSVMHDMVRTYSYGMRRKLAIIQAVAHSPRLLVMDEPSMGLDAHARAQLHSILRSATEDDAVVVVSTNDLNEAQLLGGMIHMILDGRIVRSGSSEELISSQNQSSTIAIDLEAAVPADTIPASSHLRSVQLDDSGERFVLRALVDSSSEEEALSQLVSFLVGQGAKILKVEVGRPTLEDVFRSLTEGL